MSNENYFFDLEIQGVVHQTAPEDSLGSLDHKQSPGDGSQIAQFV